MGKSVTVRSEDTHLIITPELIFYIIEAWWRVIQGLRRTPL